MKQLKEFRPAEVKFGGAEALVHQIEVIVWLAGWMIIALNLKLWGSMQMSMRNA